jgi:hypothetical protein
MVMMFLHRLLLDDEGMANQSRAMNQSHADGGDWATVAKMKAKMVAKI